MSHRVSTIIYWTQEDINKYCERKPDALLPCLDGWVEDASNGGVADLSMDFVPLYAGGCQPLHDFLREIRSRARP